MQKNPEMEAKKIGGGQISVEAKNRNQVKRVDEELDREM